MILLFYVGYGIVDVIEIICSRSFAKNDFHLIGNQTNQIRFILTFFVWSIILINIFFADKILILIVGNVNYISESHLYIKIVTPSIFLTLYYEIYSRYFESHLVYKPVMISLLISLIVHPIICWLFISYLDLGIVGAGLCSNITEFLRFTFIFIYSRCCNPFPKSNSMSNYRKFQLQTLQCSKTISY